MAATTGTAVLEVFVFILEEKSMLALLEIR
jgi:hypothetical protein